jgi:hypothetical protein
MGNPVLGAYSQTGFSYTGGQAKPIEDGIVVCSEFEDVITEVPPPRMRASVCTKLWIHYLMLCSPLRCGFVHETHYFSTKLRRHLASLHSLGYVYSAGVDAGDAGARGQAGGEARK